MRVKPPKIDRDDSSLEEAVRPLVEASTTQSWKHVLNILYLNGSVLSISDEVPIPVVVSVDDDPEGVFETLELLEAKFSTAISPLISSGAKKMIPPILNELKKELARSKSAANNEAVLQTFLISQITRLLEAPGNPLNRLLVQGAFQFGEVMAAGTFDLLAKLSKAHAQSIFEMVDYEEMVEGLQKLGIVESRLQVSICSKCANYQLVVSRFLGGPDECPKCGEIWTTARLYTFVPSYEKVKLANSDLALFISSYLRYKVFQLAPLSNLDVRPNAVLSSKGLRFEVDVYLPQFDTGVECKVFENPLAPMTSARLGSIQGPLAKQIRNYASAGISDVAIVTNLPPDTSEKLKTAMMKGLVPGNTKLEVVAGDVEELVKSMDKMAERIAEKFNKELAKGVQSVAKGKPKELPQRVPIRRGRQHITETPSVPVPITT